MLSLTSVDHLQHRRFSGSISHIIHKKSVIGDNKNTLRSFAPLEPILGKAFSQGVFTDYFKSD